MTAPRRVRWWVAGCVLLSAVSFVAGGLCAAAFVAYPPHQACALVFCGVMTVGIPVAHVTSGRIPLE